jgi:peptide/nickel transport system permease protein
VGWGERDGGKQVMWAYILRRILYSIPVYLGIILLVMAALRVNDPVGAYLGKNASEEQIKLKRKSMGLDRPFVEQYGEFVWRVVRLDFGTASDPYPSWQYSGRNVGEKLRDAIGPSLAITAPELAITTLISITVGLVSAFYRGRWLDKSLMVVVVLGMSVSVLVFIVMGQYFGAYWLNHALTARAGRPTELFATGGYEPFLTWGRVGPPGLSLPVPTAVKPGVWVYYCLLPVLIGVVVAMGYDTRFYRAVMVEESSKDYITTAVAKGATTRKIMFVHMLKNAMIPIITRIMITLPFLITGSILLEVYFRIPGMGKLLIDAITNKDFPIVQTFTAMFAAIFIASNILTDVLYALVDPRVRLS